MRFGILGPTQVWDADGAEVAVGGRRLRALLAMLLTQPGQVVTVERLVDGVYGDRPPAGAVNALRSQVARLRQLLGDAVVSHPAGYRLAVAADAIDAHRFERLARAGHHALEQRDHVRASALLRDALALWRGAALADVGPPPFAAAHATRLEEWRIAALEDRIETDLHLRWEDGAVIAELCELVATHPLRERLHAQLVRALAAAGRKAEALAAYENARRTLADELGADPSAELTATYLAVLRGQSPAHSSGETTPQAGAAEETSAGSVARPVPKMLPATIADFAGREDELAAIRSAVADPGPTGGMLAVPIVVLCGRGGVGKTTLAVHAAHTLSGSYPDGQLFATLHTATTRPVDPSRVLERFLRMLGVPGSAIPDGLDERAEVFRGLLADRRVLILLDDVGREEDVVPLLPGIRSCAVMVTCRRRLPGLTAAAAVDLGPLSPGQSLDLLSRVAGGERVRREIEPARTLVEQCGRLPLALRIAGARLASRPHWTIGWMVRRLADEERRLEELVHGGMGIRAGISLIHDALRPHTRRLFRLLALLDAHTFSAWIAAALLDLPVDAVQEHLDELVETHLVQVVTPGLGEHTHYRFHDLIRGFARQRLAADEPPADAAAVLARALEAVLCLSRAAIGPQWEHPLLSSDGPPTWPAPADLVALVAAQQMSWLDREHPLVIAAVHQAARAGLPDLCYRLALTVQPFLSLRAYHDDGRAVLSAALKAARRAGEKRAEAAVLCELWHHAFESQRFDDAERYVSQADALYRELGDERGIGDAAMGLAFIEYMAGRTGKAWRLLDRALKTARALRQHNEIASHLRQMAGISLLHGEPSAAKRLLAEAAAHARAGGDARTLGQVLHRTGQAHLQDGEADLAADVLERALAVTRDSGDAHGVAYVLTELARARLRQGAVEVAEALLIQARERAIGAKDSRAEGHTLTALAEVAIARHDPRQAAEHLGSAVELFSTLGSPHYAAQALIALGDAQREAGEAEAALGSWAAARPLAERVDPIIGNRLRAQIAERLD